MSDHGYDERVAATYDRDAAAAFGDDVLVPTVDRLAELAGPGRALELAIGTGRVALALRARGIEVAGVELSEPMVRQMMAKPGADLIPVTIGDMTTTRAAGSFRLVYLVFNTITNLLTQDEQVACFRNAAAHLEVGGCFVIEVFVPALRRLPMGERFVPFEVGPDHVGIDEYDVAGQRLVSHHYRVADGGRRTDSMHRYAWPAEYDLMAQLAGMRLRHRWGGWDRRRFTSESTAHVSVWEKVPPTARP